MNHLFLSAPTKYRLSISSDNHTKTGPLIQFGNDVITDVLKSTIISSHKDHVWISQWVHVSDQCNCYTYFMNFFQLLIN